MDGQWLLAINLSNLEIRACLARVDLPTARFGATGKGYVDLPRASHGGPIGSSAAGRSCHNNPKTHSMGQGFAKPGGIC